MGAIVESEHDRWEGVLRLGWVGVGRDGQGAEERGDVWVGDEGLGVGDAFGVEDDAGLGREAQEEG